jgi:hypothetical protein
MPRLPLIATALALALACGPAPADPEPTSSTSTSTSTDAPTTDPPPPSTSSTTTESITDHVSFISPPDHPVHKDPCQPYNQDCPPGQKCIPWAPTPGPWTTTKCVDVTGDQAPGEPCTATDGITGIDDCALGSICWYLDEAGHGTCALQCAGTSDAPICPLKSSCGSDQYGVLALCFANCEPLLQDCPRGKSCLPLGQSFTCFHDASGEEGQANDPCESFDFCDPGLVCIDAASASDACDQRFEKCCQPFCEFPDGPCPNADQECLPLEETPPGYGDLGLCALPM